MRILLLWATAHMLRNNVFEPFWTTAPCTSVTLDASIACSVLSSGRFLEITDSLWFLPGACRGLVMPGATAWLCVPYQILVLRNVRNTGTAKIPAQIFAMSNWFMPQNLVSSENKEEKKLYESRIPRCATITRVLNFVKTYVQGHRVRHGTFGEKKVKHLSASTLALCWKNQVRS